MKPIQSLEHDIVIKQETIDIEYAPKNMVPFPIQCQDQQMATVKAELDTASPTQGVDEVTVKDEMEIGPSEFVPQHETPGVSYCKVGPGTSVMPYKVVLTIEKGKTVLTSVPHSWEKDGILFWPRKSTTEKVKQGGDPKDDWNQFNCIVKRKNIMTFEDAEEEIDRMCEHADTEYIETADEIDEPAKKRYKKNKPKMCISSTIPDFNDQAQECTKNLGNQTNSEERIIECHKNYESASSPLVPSASLLVSDKYSSEIILKPIEVPVKIQSVDIPNSNTIQTDTFLADVNNLNEGVYVLTQADEAPTRQDNLKTKTDNISAILQSVLDNQRILNENQQNMTLELVKLNTRFEEFIKGFLTREGQVENILDFTAIAKIEDLEELESKLKNQEYKTEFEKKFSVVCHKQNGKGLNTAYKLVDIIFKRDFMKQCSWAGGSRGEGKKKCFKAFQRTIDLFFNMVRATDNLFTLEDCETFFKNILRNSKKRSLTNMRQSTTKKRPKNINKNSINTKEPEKSNKNENVTKRDAVDDNDEEEEEEEGSLL